MKSMHYAVCLICMIAAQTLALTIADTEYEIGFESSQSTSVTNIIHEDFDRIFSPISAFSGTMMTNEEGSIRGISNVEPWMIPTGVLAGIRIDTQQEIPKIIVSDQLVLKYETAVQFTNTVSTQMTELTNFLSELRTGAVTNRELSEKKELIWSASQSLPDDISDEQWNENARILAKIQPNAPSLLGIEKSEENGMNYLFASTVQTGTDNGETMLFVTTWVYHNGRWKFFIP